MAISTHKLNLVPFLPVANPPALVAFPSLVLAVRVVNIKGNGVVKAAPSTFVSQIPKQFSLLVFVVLYLATSCSLLRFFVGLLLAFIATIPEAFRFVGLVTDKASWRSPPIDQITILATKPRLTIVKNSKLFAAFFAITVLWHNISFCILYVIAIGLFNKKIEYCEIARKRIEAAEKGITVKELEKGQGVLF